MLNVAIKAARAAGAIINRAALDVESVRISQKQINDFVTEVDHAAEKIIIETLLTAYPGHGILAEESGQEYGAKHSDFVWVIDPLDGTTNFIHGLPYFAISVALMRHGRSELGVIYNPVANEMFYARRGSGAYMNGIRLPLKAAPASMGDTIAAVEVKYLRSGKLGTRLTSLAPFGSQRSLGASTIDWCYLAAGRYDLYLHGGQRLWDYAAGIVILEEAGGQACTLDSDDYWQGPLWHRSAVAALDPCLFEQWRRWVRNNQ